MGVHQLFFPLVCETNENVLARALQALGVICDKVHEALNVDIIFEVHGQNVSHFRSSWRSYVSPIGNSALRRLSESKPLNRVHSTIELPVTTRHCGYSLVDKSTFGRGSSRESNIRLGSTHRAGRRQNPRPSSENDVCG